MLSKWMIGQILLLQCSWQHRTEYRRQVSGEEQVWPEAEINFRQAAWGSSGEKSGEEPEDYTPYGMYFVVVVVVDSSVHVYNQNETVAIVFHTSPLFFG